MGASLFTGNKGNANARDNFGLIKGEDGAETGSLGFIGGLVRKLDEGVSDKVLAEEGLVR